MQNAHRVDYTFESLRARSTRVQNERDESLIIFIEKKEKDNSSLSDEIETTERIDISSFREVIFLLTP